MIFTLTLSQQEPKHFHFTLFICCITICKVTGDTNMAIPACVSQSIGFNMKAVEGFQRNNHRKTIENADSISDLTNLDLSLS